MKNQLMINPILIFAFFFFLLFPLSGHPYAAENGSERLIRKTVFGLMLHDRGPVSDRHESGVDPNWEIQLNPPDWKLWRWIGAPYPMLGLTPNFNGDTSVFYGGVSYELGLSNKFTDKLTYDLTKKLFVSGSLSLALHNGPLRKDKVGCEERSDCGFGYRAIPRIALELGINLRDNHGVSLFWDHMSHKGLGSVQNEGIDHTGIRYHYTFNIPALKTNSSN